MALTEAQKTDVRRYAGYNVAGSVPSLKEPVYLASGYVITTLDTRLDSLTDSEETVLADTYLANLAALELAILGVSDNLDTSEAGPWKGNPRELAGRRALFNGWRRDMCAFLGVEPGPALGGGSGLAVVRA